MNQTPEQILAAEKTAKFGSVVKLAMDNLNKEAKKQGINFMMAFMVRDKNCIMEQTTYGSTWTACSLHDVGAFKYYIDSELMKE